MGKVHLHTDPGRFSGNMPRVSHPRNDFWIVYSEGVSPKADNILLVLYFFHSWCCSITL